MLTVKEAIQLLQEGEVVAFPTETVYGLGASIYHSSAIAKIFAKKGRPSDNPLIIHISSLEQLSCSFPTVLTALWPGPLTLVVPRPPEVPLCATAGLETVAVRMPDHPIALEILTATGPLVAPSANLSGRPSPTQASHVLEDLDVEVVDGGICSIGLESTVLSLVGEPTLLRPGVITQNELEERLGKKILLPGASVERPSSPGMKYKHYSPNAKLYVFESREEIEGHITKSKAKREIAYSLEPERLYQFLRYCDQIGCEEIVILLHDKLKLNEAFLNRINKAKYK
ncbi:MAG: L-threonylcarbamoyladenylate synthase [Chlamydiales bacterium]